MLVSGRTIFGASHPMEHNTLTPTKQPVYPLRLQNLMFRLVVLLP